MIKLVAFDLDGTADDTILMGLAAFGKIVLFFLKLKGLLRNEQKYSFRYSPFFLSS